jgi:hypothetical protein
VKESVGGGVSPAGSTWHDGHWLDYCSLLRMITMMENLVEWRLTGETEVLVKKTLPSVTLSTTNPTWPDPGSNPGRLGGKPATNSLKYGGAYMRVLVDYEGQSVRNGEMKYTFLSQEKKAL